MASEGEDTSWVRILSSPSHMPQHYVLQVQRCIGAEEAGRERVTRISPRPRPPFPLSLFCRHIPHRQDEHGGGRERKGFQCVYLTER